MIGVSRGRCALLAALSAAVACRSERAPAGGVTIARGYALEPVLAGLDAPTVAIFDGNDLLVAESGRRGTAGPRILRVRGREDVETVAATGLRAPVTGLALVDGRLFVSHAGSVAEVQNGSLRAVLDGLPSEGDHPNTRLARGPDGKLYLGQGTRTDAGVVGPDNFADGWPLEHPGRHEVPCRDVVLNGQSFVSDNPLTPEEGDLAVTGAYRPFGQPAAPGDVVHGQPRCGGSIARFAPDGTAFEVMAWGLRHPLGLRFDRAGRLWATSQGPQARGSRAIFDAPDVLVRVQEDAWYGWPDFIDGEPASARRFQAPDRARPRLLWQHHPPLARHFASFPGGPGLGGLDFSPGEPFGFGGDAFVAASGRLGGGGASRASERPRGFRVLRVDMKTGESHDFIRTEDDGPPPPGQASLQQPVDAFFGPDRALYVVDMGWASVASPGRTAVPGTGAVWRISRRPPETGPVPMARAERALRALASSGWAPGTVAAATAAGAALLYWRRRRRRRRAAEAGRLRRSRHCR